MRKHDVLKSKNIPVFYVADEQSFNSDHHDGTRLGFWIYLMSDCLMFAVLFVTYAVLAKNYAAGPAPIDIFNLKDILISTFILLFSSVSYSLAMLASENIRKNATIFFLLITAFLGIVFIVMEVNEFAHLVIVGATPQRSAFLSSFFTLVGVHGLHVFFGILWIFVLLVQILKHGLIPANRRRMMCLSMFWHFLDLIWICVFSFVYLIGVI
ncbi:MAG: cytochrome o ubiquinol oxidase subunit III [Candidatus Liberibacter europaeus]|uniref:Cytochrome bo(3) ubiquinol oxidase subunit 3 n=1 Tax=Candidatus Liberibacter europaeus TaxID=744859 RepID=A0A2T4VYX5_9HYPH|nr:cytochrome o ubiquinol oxidase subunit III [Candidatus Liberibacter europaeus]PTL86968.1 MAG: cytochrome o ubiquinol oxidase subunit III [Candidatus Liberibacter europaeus]